MGPPPSLSQKANKHEASEAASVQPNARILLASGYSRSQLPTLPSNVQFLSKPYRFKQLIAAINNQF